VTEVNLETGPETKQGGPYLVLAFYLFAPIHDPREEVERHKAFFQGRDVSCRIYLSEEGINGQMSAALQDAEGYMAWMREHPLFKNIHFKIHTASENVFPKVTVKYRRELVARDKSVDMTRQGTHLTPQEWKNWLESDKERVILDVRNDYEWKVGHFKGAELPRSKTFRDFKEYASELKGKVDEKKPILMYCTGGIRCEVYSALLKEEGFEEVYQLQGGVINYGLEEGNTHWEGKLFVFDDRLVVPISEEPTAPISTCTYCATSNDSYVNCANMACNELFLCCESCLKKEKGCCSEVCKTSSALRPLRETNFYKPFRKAHHYNSVSCSL